MSLAMSNTQRLRYSLNLDVKFYAMFILRNRQKPGAADGCADVPHGFFKMTFPMGGGEICYEVN
jgi:hypothetical protein